MKTLSQSEWLAEQAIDSKNDLIEAITKSTEIAYSKYSVTSKPVLYLTTLFSLALRLYGFKTKVKNLFLDLDVTDPKMVKDVVEGYNKLLVDNKSFIVRLFELADADPTADPITRFNAYTFNGYIG